MGNAQVSRLIQQGRLTTFGGVVQPKLSVGAAKDPLESEADQTARQVMAISDEEAAMASAGVGYGPGSASATTMQRQSEASATDSFDAGPQFESRIGQAKGGGTPLPDHVRSFMEPRFGADLSVVRVHTGGDAAEMSRSIGAKAFTHGTDIYYGESHRPANSELTAHEVTHVLQQTGHAARSPVIQRKGPEDAEVPETTPIVEAKDETGTAPVTAGSTPATPAVPKTVDLTLSAMYDQVPGKSKNTVKDAKGTESLWFDPLTMHSNHPMVKRNSRSRAVISGGQTTIDTFKAPISGGEPKIGTGSITSQLKYSSQAARAYSVNVSGIKNHLKGSARRSAQKFVASEMEVLGDVDEIAANTEQHLVEEKPELQGVSVRVSVNNRRVRDAGRVSFFYRAGGPGQILMSIKASPVAESRTKFGSSKTTGGESEREDEIRTKQRREREGIHKENKDRYRKGESSLETHDVDYAEKVVRTIDDLVKASTDVHDEVASDLAETVVTDNEAKYTDKTKSSTKSKKSSDYSKDLEKTVEEGERNKENWAAKARKGVKFVKDVTRIPFVDKIPGIGWVSRRVKGWQLDIADGVLGWFEEKGTVKFKDTKLDEDVEREDKSKGSSKSDRRVKLTEDKKTKLKSKLREEYKSATSEEWKRRMTDITDVQKTYRSRIKKDAQTDVDKDGSEDYGRAENIDEVERKRRALEKRNKSTTVRFEGETIWKYSKPMLEATVVDGDVEVSSAVMSHDEQPADLEEANP